jgi:hypothetical protein
MTASCESSSTDPRGLRNCVKFDREAKRSEVHRIPGEGARIRVDAHLSLNVRNLSLFPTWYPHAG